MKDFEITRLDTSKLLEKPQNLSVETQYLPLQTPGHVRYQRRFDRINFDKTTKKQRIFNIGKHVYVGLISIIYIYISAMIKKGFYRVFKTVFTKKLMIFLR